jgi:hypothetical protein
MTVIWIQKIFRPIKSHAPPAISRTIRSAGTAILTPVMFSLRTGHWRSSFRTKAVSASGLPVPWYTYPCIDFLKYRSYENRAVLEFGSGQSTLWWAQRAARVVAVEGDASWFEILEPEVPSNVELHLVNDDDLPSCLKDVKRVLAAQSNGKFDVVVIDGLQRSGLVDVAVRSVKEDGIIVCDNAESYGFYEAFKDRDFHRVDFFGNAPGVILPHCTSIFFHENAFAFAPNYEIPVIAK